MSDQRNYIDEFTINPKTLRVTGGRFYEDGSRVLVDVRLEATTKPQQFAFPDGQELIVQLCPTPVPIPDCASILKPESGE